MPATRSLKPLLKFTLLLCFLFVFYRSFVQPRLSPSSSSTSTSTTNGIDPRTRQNVGGGDGNGRKGVNWSREGSGAAAGKEPRKDSPPPPDFKPKPFPRQQLEERPPPPPPPPLPRPPPPRAGKGREHEIEREKQKVEQIVKQVPKQVPAWVVEHEIGRVEGNGEKVPIWKPVRAGGGRGGEKDTFKKELERMKQRKEQKGLGGGGRRRPQTGDQEEEEEEPEDGTEEEVKGRRVYHLVDEDDELDAAQRGDSDARVAMAGQRKKGPLIQVGGAGNAAGDKNAGAGVGGIVAGAGDAVKAKGKDKWKGKGWDQRFKKQGGDKEEQEGAQVEGEGNNERAVKAVEPIDSNTDNSAEEEQSTEKLLVQHPLVARFLRQDISHNGDGSSPARTQVTFSSPDDEDAASDRKLAKEDDLRSTPPTSSERHNLTVCALVPNEQRFLPEWILYHSLLGVSRFALYDTTLPGAFGGEEIDQLADSMREEGGGGENAPTVEELKAQVAVSNSGREGLDEKGLIRRERVRGLEDWIDKGRVKMFYMKFKNPRASHDVHALMLENCVERFGPSSNWLAHLDVDEFLSLSTPLYGSDEPYSVLPSDSTSTDSLPDHVYPLHDLLASPALDSALCLPVPELNYRNLGIRELKRSQGVLETQVHRDVLGEVKESTRFSEERGGLPQKTLIHTAFTSQSGVTFSGPHSCELTNEDSEDGIRDSQGNPLASRGGLYHSQNLPIEPLAIAHYVQRDLLDCHSKLSSLADPLSLKPKGRGSVSCEAHYLPSASELASESWRNDPANEDLKKVPPLGSVLEDRRIATSWAARAATTIGDAWRRSQERGMRRTSKSERERLVSRVREKVEVLSY
ncbi:uncharacterized protein JCM6883_000872 [Sporobolomyces salmoneus]|uniref:uncharacterized protein n=1 Tax=Sporobolomyces salmoneus TaxID=183962 RepID=UPI00318223C2